LCHNVEIKTIVYEEKVEDYPIFNGFLRCQNGTWINLSKVLYFALDERKMTEKVDIVAWYIEREDFEMKLSDYSIVATFTTSEKAQKTLDQIMNKRTK
jgi:hypothetical protein